jgi:hypothetical protein
VKKNEENRETIDRKPLESQELLQSLCSVFVLVGLEQRYGLPICWAVHTLAAVNQPTRLANLAVGE